MLLVLAHVYARARTRVRARAYSCVGFEIIVTFVTREAL